MADSTAGVNLGCLPDYFLESESIRGFWNVRILRQFIKLDRPQNTKERVATDLMKEYEFRYLNIHAILASLFSCYIKFNWWELEPAKLRTLPQFIRVETRK